MRADPELFKDKIEVSLDNRQIFYLFFGGAVLISLVFVLGVMVGKRVEARAHIAQPGTSAAVDPLAALDELAQRPSGDELAFSSALAGGADRPLGTVDQVLTQTQPRPATRYQSNASAVTKPDRKSRSKPRSPAASGDSKGATDAADSGRDKAVSAAREVANKPAARSAADKPAATKSARFTLQISSFQERTEADAFVRRLRTSGYAPYMTKSELPDKGIWYRVRLGRYGSWDEAVEAKKKFEKREHIIAYVTRLKRR